ncbi:hypothetical protein [Microbacterium sp. NPDC057650]|uniref:hypothetical protein n=1 Tax=unclassified Microbacterium TaxID=2609290 RepID=UPI00366F4B75
MRALAVAASIGMSVALLAGCAPKEEHVPTPTGDALYSQAEQHYRDYRQVTNGIQKQIYDGPWEVGDGGYGMVPEDGGCEAGSYAFELSRATDIAPDDIPAMRDKLRTYLTEQGYDIGEWGLGSGESESLDLIIEKQGDFSDLRIISHASGAVRVRATSACWPGNIDDLDARLFGDVYLSDGYLPDEESPSDPLFWGITPGDPQFLEPGQVPQS